MFTPFSDYAYICGRARYMVGVRCGYTHQLEQIPWMSPQTSCSIEKICYTEKNVRIDIHYKLQYRSAQERRELEGNL